MIIESRDQYFSLIKKCDENKKSILAVKSHIAKNLPFEVSIDLQSKIVKFRTKDTLINGKIKKGDPIGELSLTDGFITDKLDSNLIEIEAEYKAIDAAFQILLNQ